MWKPPGIFGGSWINRAWHARREKNIFTAHHCQLTAMDGRVLVVVNLVYYLICFPHDRENIIAAKPEAQAAKIAQVQDFIGVT